MNTELEIADKVREFEKRIFEFLPGAASVPQPIRLAMAHIAVAHGLDPFIKEVWPIPQKNRSGEIVGWDLMIGIAGWRAAAWRSNEYWGRRFEKCTEEERGWLGAKPTDIALKCIVMRRRTGQQPMEFDGYGLFRVGNEYTKMNQLQCARYRAERDAMKAAFPISLPAGVGAKVADEETGEIINGTHTDGPQWDVIATTAEQPEPPIEQVKEPDTLDELTEVTQREAVTNEPAPQEQWPMNYDSFCAWMKAHGYSSNTTRQVFGTDVRAWLDQNPIQSYETAAMTVKATMGK